MFCYKLINVSEVFPPNPVPPPKPEDLPVFAVTTSKCPSDQLNGIDLIFALDVSASVGAARYAAGMKFIELRVSNLVGHIGTGSGVSDIASLFYSHFVLT